MGKHRSMDQSASEPRPYCKTHKQFFRNWPGAYAHKATHSGCVLETRMLKTR